MKNFYRLRKAILSCAFFLGIYNVTDAQVNSYTFSQSSGTYTPLVLGTVIGAPTAMNPLDSSVFPVNLPFSFNFNGINYSSLFVSTNGFVTFGTAPGSTTYWPISGVMGYQGAISAWGRDISAVYNINGTTGSLTWDVVGTAPNREVVIQWENFKPKKEIYTSNTVYGFSFQIHLKETGAIAVVYKKGGYIRGSGEITDEVGPEIGLRGAANSDFNNRISNAATAFTNSHAGGLSNSRQAFSTESAIPGMPEDGLTYTWTPSNCKPPLSVTVGNITKNTANISWTPPAAAPAEGYDLYYSTSDLAPDASSQPSVSGIIGSSYSISSGLQPGTVYYVWLRSRCSTLEQGNWTQAKAFLTMCQPSEITSVTGSEVCAGPVSMTLSATAAQGTTISWYDEQTGGNKVGTGNTFITPLISSTKDYWVSASTESVSTMGKVAPYSLVEDLTYESGMVFNAEKDFILKSVDIYPLHNTSTTGLVKLVLKNSAGVELQSKTANVNVLNYGVLNTIPLDFNVPAGSGYRLVITASSGVSKLLMEASGTEFSYPYVIPGVGSITSAFSGGSNTFGTYRYFYNWKVLINCESERKKVTAAIGLGCLNTSETEMKKAIEIYPNPFSDRIKISRPELVKSLQVLDVSGRIIKTIDNLSKEIHLGDLKSGLYILNLNMKDGTQKQTKVIKQ